jgi:hypothetical protein
LRGPLVLWGISSMMYFLRALRVLRGYLNPVKSTTKLTKGTKGTLKMHLSLYLCPCVLRRRISKRAARDPEFSGGALSQRV